MNVCHRQRFMIALHPGTHWSVDSCRTMCQFRQPRSLQLKWRMAEWLQFKMWCPVPQSKQVLFFRELSSPNGSDKVDKVRSSARKLSIFLSKRSANLWRTRPSKRWNASRLAVGWVHQTFKTRCLQLCWQHRKNQEKNPFHRIPFQEPKKKHTKHLHGTCPRARRHRHMPLPISPSCVTSDKLRPGLWQLLANRLQQVAPQSVCRQTWRWNLDTEGIPKSQAAMTKTPE